MEAPLEGTLLFSSVSASFPGSPAVPSSAASSESLQCEGPVSTRDSGCRPREDVGSREVDYLARGYTFSRPIRLVVSYGKVLGRSSPTFHSSPSAQSPCGKVPQELATNDSSPSLSAHRPGALSPRPWKFLGRELPGSPEKAEGSAWAARGLRAGSG